MSSYNYLLKPLPTSLDLFEVRREHKRLEYIIDAYLSGFVTEYEFIRAREQLNDLLYLTTKATNRLNRSKFRIVKESE